MFTIKEEASGYPEHCQTDADRERYLDEVRRREGIVLNPLNMVRNEGKRQIAKLMLNR